MTLLGALIAELDVLRAAAPRSVLAFVASGSSGSFLLDGDGLTSSPASSSADLSLVVDVGYFW